MKKFIKESLDKAYRLGGKYYQYIVGCARRTEEFLGKKWFVYLESKRMFRADDVDVYILFGIRISDLKLKKYQGKQDKIISELNYLLTNEGLRWIVTRTDNFFRTPLLVHFRFSRAAKGWIDIGKPSLWEATQLVGQLLIMKGFCLNTARIEENGVMIYHSWGPEPSASDISELENLLTYQESEWLIDNTVEKAVEEEAKPKEPPKPTIERIEATARNIIIAAVVIMMIYLLIVYQAPIKLGFRALEKKLEKKKE